MASFPALSVRPIWAEARDQRGGGGAFHASAASTSRVVDLGQPQGVGTYVLVLVRALTTHIARQRNANGVAVAGGRAVCGGGGAQGGG